MLADPDDPEEILLTENCIDCSEYYAGFKKETASTGTTISSLKIITDNKCKITEIVEVTVAYDPINYDLKRRFVQVKVNNSEVIDRMEEYEKHPVNHVFNFEIIKPNEKQPVNCVFYFEIINSKKIKFSDILQEFD